MPARICRAPGFQPPFSIFGAVLFATDQRTAAVALTGISNPIAGSARCAEHRPGDGLGVVGFAVFGAENFNLCCEPKKTSAGKKEEGLQPSKSYSEFEPLLRTCAPKAMQWKGGKCTAIERN